MAEAMAHSGLTKHPGAPSPASDGRNPGTAGPAPPGGTVHSHSGSGAAELSDQVLAAAAGGGPGFPITVKAPDIPE